MLQLGIENIAINGNLSPSLSQVQLAGANGLALQRVSKVEDSFNILSGCGEDNTKDRTERNCKRYRKCGGRFFFWSGKVKLIWKRNCC